MRVPSETERKLCYVGSDHYSTLTWLPSTRDQSPAVCWYPDYGGSLALSPSLSVSGDWKLNSALSFVPSSGPDWLAEKRPLYCFQFHYEKEFILVSLMKKYRSYSTVNIYVPFLTFRILRCPSHKTKTTFTASYYSSNALPSIVSLVMTIRGLSHII